MTRLPGGTRTRSTRREHMQRPSGELKLANDVDRGEVRGGVRGRWGEIAKLSRR